MPGAAGAPRPVTDPVAEYDVVILGAGMAGLGAAVEAQRLGLDSLVLEAAPEAGGLCRGTTVAGCSFDRYGPKIMVDRPTAEPLVALLAGGADRHDLHEVVALPGVGLVGFPVQRYLVDLPAADRETVLAQVAQSRSRTTRQVRNYREWLLDAYGPYLCERVLFPYEEKKWQMPLAEMDYRWAASRPVAVSDEEIREGARVRLGPSRHYFYPSRGSLAQLVAALAARAGPMILGADVTAIDLPRRTVTAGGRTYRYRHLISTVPLDRAVAMSRGLEPELVAAARQELRWLSIRVYNLVFAGRTPLTGGAVYFPDPAVGFRRVANLHNLCPGLVAPDRTALSVEMAIGTAGLSQAPPPRDVGDVIAEMRTLPEYERLGPLLGSDTVDIAHAYPLQRDTLQDHVRRVLDAYAAYGVQHCGRAGSFAYCDTDIAFDQGTRAARRAGKDDTSCNTCG
jgi:protoporphyrinogen oxidase